MSKINYQTRRQEIEKVLRTAGLNHGMYARSAALQRASAEGDGEGLAWILSTEKPSTIFDWHRWELVDEVLLADGMVVPENGQVVLLDSHSRYSVKDVLGHVGQFGELNVGEYAARSGVVFFADDEASQTARQKVEGGHITDGSVGYQQLESVYVPEGEKYVVNGRTFEGPVRVTSRWSLREFSITPIGADVLAKVRILCGAKP